MSIIPGTSVVTEYDPNLDPNGRTLTLNPPTPVEYGRTVTGGIDDDSTTADGMIISVAIKAGAAGKNYKAGDATISAAGDGVDATFTFTVKTVGSDAGVLDTVTIKTNGTGYVDGEELTVPDTSGGAGGSGGKIVITTQL